MDWMGGAYHARKKQVKATGLGILAKPAGKVTLFSMLTGNALQMLMCSIRRRLNMKS